MNTKLTGLEALIRKDTAKHYREVRQALRNGSHKPAYPAESVFFGVILACLIGIALMASCRVCHAQESFKSEEVDMAIIATIESHNHPEVKSPKGAIGLCQIMPATLKDFNKHFKTSYRVRDLYLGDINLMIADWYINQQIPHYLKHYRLPDTLENRLRAYNSGIGTLKKGIYPTETREYVRKYNRLTKGGR